ncbi:MAG TPA: hypothetical protein VFL42_13755 [Terriglobales bacterium]|nr:hypothetical protein [Terriglobales bacterium]
MLNPNIAGWRKGAALVAAAALSFAAPAPVAPVKPFIAYHDGGDIVFSPEHTGTRRMASFGPWNFGERLNDDGKPVDKRLNLYVVAPGAQYRSPVRPEYDHNRVVNKYTADGKVHEWDIFWCFVLDPALTVDLRSERELLLAKQQTFHPADLFDISDVPAHAAMAERLGIATFADLKRFRHKDGSLPRLVIVPARLAVRATAELQDVTVTQPVAQK